MRPWHYVVRETIKFVYVPADNTSNITYGCRMKFKFQSFATTNTQHYNFRSLLPATCCTLCITVLISKILPTGKSVFIFHNCLLQRSWLVMNNPPHVKSPVRDLTCHNFRLEAPLYTISKVKMRHSKVVIKNSTIVLISGVHSFISNKLTKKLIWHRNSHYVVFLVSVGLVSRSEGLIILIWDTSLSTWLIIDFWDTTTFDLFRSIRPDASHKLRHDLHGQRYLTMNIPVQIDYTSSVAIRVTRLFIKPQAEL